MGRPLTQIPLGTRFSLWTVTGATYRIEVGRTGRVYTAPRTYVRVTCDCGHEAVRQMSDLKSGKSRHCLSCAQRRGPSDVRTIQKDKLSWLLEEKNSPCVDCGFTLPSYCMQFDHVEERGKKLFEINKATVRGRWSLEEVKAEREKCDLVCSNCHDHRTWERLNNLPHVPLNMKEPELCSGSGVSRCNAGAGARIVSR